MRKFSTFLFTLLLLSLCIEGISQERYLDDVFTDVDVQTGVKYGSNYSMLPVFLGLRTDTVPVDLVMDVYTPMGDTETSRPVVIYGIGGTFFPKIINRGFTGERDDPHVVDFATAMAKKGYVVAVVQYRRGWNPAGSALTQQKTILHAAYRGIQDMRNVVRFLKKTFVEDANMYGIDTSRIAVGGTGTGGYMSYGATYLKRYEQTLKAKFFDFSDTANPVPFLDTLVFGDPMGITPASINVANYPTYSSEFQMGFAFGGALGDSSWVEAGDAPFVSLHCINDPGAPFNLGDVISVDPTTQPTSFFAVIPDGSGGQLTLKRANELGNQAVFANVDWGDPLFDLAASKNGGLHGLYPFNTPFTSGPAGCDPMMGAGDTLLQWGGPWNYYDETIGAMLWDTAYKAAIAVGAELPGNLAVCDANRGNPNDPVIAAAYLDTLLRFLVPHLNIALDLPTSVGVNRFIADENVEVFPNPANQLLRVRYKNGIKPIEGIRILDINGRTVREIQNINRIEYTLQREDLVPGLYIMQVSLDDGVVNKKILFE